MLSSLKQFKTMIIVTITVLMWTWLTVNTLPYQVVGLQAKTRFSKSLSNTRIYKRTSGISIKLCSEECLTRPRCKLTIYNRAAKVCSLTQETVSVDAFAQKGQVVLQGFDELRMSYPWCGDIVCSLEETCVKENKEFVCKVTECTKINIGDCVRVHGNIYDVSSKLSKEDFIFDKTTTMTCGETGRWDNGTTQAYCHICCQPGVSVYSTSVGAQLYNVEYYCDMDTDCGHWVVFQRRQDGSENFYRGWADYANGFGNLDGEFWLGLANMYSILSTGEFELRIDLESFEGERRYAKYSSFSIGPPSDNYRLHVSGYSGDAGDSFSSHNGLMFTTFDVDNDRKDEANCAVRYKGAWWYGACHSANLNGLYYHGGEKPTAYATHVIWSRWLGYYFSLKRTEMKFRKLP